MKFATKSRHTQILVWLIWLIALLVFTWMPEQAAPEPADGPPTLMGIVTHQRRDGPLFPWEPRRRLRSLAWRRRCALERVRRRARWVKFPAQLALKGALTMATVVDLLTQAQLRRYMEALPIRQIGGKLLTCWMSQMVFPA